MFWTGQFCRTKGNCLWCDKIDLSQTLERSYKELLNALLKLVTPNSSYGHFKQHNYSLLAIQSNVSYPNKLGPEGVQITEYLDN